MTSEEGINEWMETYNAEIAAASAPPIPLPAAQNENARPFHYSLKRVTGKGQKKNRKRK